MKKIFCALVIIAVLIPGAWADVEINDTNFPDAVFRDYIFSRGDKDKDGVLTD